MSFIQCLGARIAFALHAGKALLRGIEHDRYVLQPLFRYHPEADRLESTGTQPSWLAR